MQLSAFNRMVKRYPVKWMAIAFFIWLALLLKYCGVFTCFFTRDYFTEFTYPLEGDIPKYVSQLRSGRIPDVLPIEQFNYELVRYNTTKCQKPNREKETLDLLILVKSSLYHRGNRGAIRRTWGQEYRLPRINMRVLFLLGSSSGDKNLDKMIEYEQNKYGDLLQWNFVDAYFNNTIKTMQGIRWVTEKCKSAKYILFSDDDMYISVKNLLQFINNPYNYPKESETMNIPKMLFAGSVFLVAPVRTQFSKWYISVEEYPFSHYPPFVNAGSFVLSYEALEELYYGSLFTKYLRFDDVFLGLVAKKMKIDPIHSDYFYNWKKGYTKASYKDVVAVHGYGDPISLTRIWNEQNSLNNN